MSPTALFAMMAGHDRPLTARPSARDRRWPAPAVSGIRPANRAGARARGAARPAGHSMRQVVPDTAHHHKGPPFRVGARPRCAAAPHARRPPAQALPEPRSFAADRENPRFPRSGRQLHPHPCAPRRREENQSGSPQSTPSAPRRRGRSIGWVKQARRWEPVRGFGSWNLFAVVVSIGILIATIWTIPNRPKPESGEDVQCGGSS